jgi:hypothetical protein
VPWADGHREKLGASTPLLRPTVAVTARALVVLHTQIEYSSLPPAQVWEPLRITWAVTQIAPALGRGFGDFDGDGLGDLDGLFDGDGEGEALLVGVVLFDGLGVALFDGPDEWLGFGLALPVGCGVPEGLGLVEDVGLCEGLTLAEVVALTEGLDPANTLAWVTAVEAEPQVELSGLTMAASALWSRAGAIAGAASRNNPAPAPTATCAARTTLTGTAALRW